MIGSAGLVLSSPSILKISQVNLSQGAVGTGWTRLQGYTFSERCKATLVELMVRANTPFMGGGSG